MNTNKAIEFLLARGNLPILYWLKKDILEVPIDRESKNLCKFAARIRILDSQKGDGSWAKKRSESRRHDERAYHLVETLKNVYKLYDYGCSLVHEKVQNSIKFLFSSQSREGDLRLAPNNEHSPTFHVLALEILCRYGLDKDKRIQKGFRWILRNRQNDGGWAIPFRTLNKKELKQHYESQTKGKFNPLKADKTQPFSHMVTGMVLRAFAESPTWRKSKEAKKAGELILSRFFKDDIYEDRKQSSFWEEVSYPFWTTNILSSLDALSRLGFSPEDEVIRCALEWLWNKQNSSGFWEAESKKSSLEDHLWVTIAVMRVFKRFGLLEL